MNPMVHTGNSNSNSNSNSASNSNSNSTSNIYANNNNNNSSNNSSNNNNSNSNSNSNSNNSNNRNVNSTAADTEGVASRGSDSREKGLRARAGKMLSRSMPSFKRKEPSTASSASEATSSDAEGTAAPALTPAPSTSMSPSMSAGPLDPTSDASSVQLRELSYSDAMTALGRREKERLQDKSWVLIPALAETEPCRRCGQLFDADDNDSNACAFHADRDGKLGEYRRVAVRNGTGGSQRLTLVKMWTCCHRTEENCPGCFSRPHICKDVMVSVRALGAPTMRIENIEMSVLRALEISIFPGAMTSWLQVLHFFYDFHSFH